MLSPRPFRRINIVLLLATGVFFFGGAAADANAALLVYFNFNDDNTTSDGGTQPGISIIPSPTNGVSGFAYQGGTTLNALGGDSAGDALTVIGSGNNGKSFQFTLSTLGMTNVALSYATRQGGPTGFSLQTLAYSTNAAFLTLAALGYSQRRRLQRV